MIKWFAKTESKLRNFPGSKLTPPPKKKNPLSIKTAPKQVWFSCTLFAKLRGRDSTQLAILRNKAITGPGWVPGELRQKGAPFLGKSALSVCKKTLEV